MTSQSPNASDHLLALAHGRRATSASLLHGVGRAHGRESDTAAQVGGNEEGVVEVRNGSVHRRGDGANLLIFLSNYVKIGRILL